MQYFRSAMDKISIEDFMEVDKDNTLIITETWDGATTWRNRGFTYSYPCSHINGNNFFLKGKKTNMVCFIGNTKEKTHMRELFWKINTDKNLSLVTLNEV